MIESDLCFVSTVPADEAYRESERKEVFGVNDALCCVVHRIDCVEDPVGVGLVADCQEFSAVFLDPFVLYRGGSYRYYSPVDLIDKLFANGESEFSGSIVAGWGRVGYLCIAELSGKVD